MHEPAGRSAARAGAFGAACYLAWQAAGLGLREAAF